MERMRRAGGRTVRGSAKSAPPWHCVLPACLGALLVSACEETGAVRGETQTTSSQPAAPRAGLPQFFDCLDREGVTLVSAHRGTDGQAPENALRSIEAVAGRTGGLVEVDVATSADGVLYLHHDDTLDRTTTGRGSANASWAVLRDLSLRDADGRVTAERPTRLDEFLTWADGRVVPQLDVKPTTDYDDLAAVLRETGAEARVVVIAYSLGQARLIARKMPGVMISATVERASDLDALRGAGVRPERILAWTGNDRPNPALWQALDDAGVEVIFGTLGGRDSLDEVIEASGDEARYASLARDGADILATDRPVEAARALRAAGVRTDASSCLADG